MFGFLGKKKTKSPIDERNFLKITWHKDYSDKLPIVKDILESVDQERNSFLNTKTKSIFDTLPYLTFLEAEILISEIKDQFVTHKGEDFLIEKIEVVYRDTNKKMSTEGELFIQPLIIHSNFVSLIKILVETMFNDSNFSQYSYQSKYYYFTGNANSENKENQRGLFDEYLKSTHFPDDYLPILPTEDEADLGGYEAVIPSKKELVEYQEKTINEIQSTEIQSDEKNVLGSTKNDEELIPPILVNQDKSNQPNLELNLGKIKRNEWQQEDEFTNIGNLRSEPRLIKSENIIHELKFPFFSYSEVQKTDIKEYESEWVDLKTNKIKSLLNEKIKTQEKSANELLNQLIQKSVHSVVNDKKKEINDWLSENDNRSDLKKQTIAENIKLKNEAKEKEVQELEKRRNGLIAEEEKRHKQKLAEIDLAFANSSKELDTKLKQEYLTLANQQYEEKYLIQTKKLQMYVDDQLEKIEELKPELHEKFFNELNQSFVDIGQQIFNEYEKSLKKYELYFKQENLSAQWQYNLERQELILKQQKMETKKEIKEVSESVNELKDVINIQFTENVEKQKNDNSESEILKIVELFTQSINKLHESNSKTEISDVPTNQIKKNGFLSKWRSISAGVVLLLFVGGGTANTVVQGNNNNKIIEQTKLSTDKQEQLSTALINSQLKVEEQLSIFQKTQEEIAKRPVYKLPIVEGGTPIESGDFLTGSIED